MADASLALQKAVIDVVKAAIAPVPVYDHLPYNIAMPYVVWSDPVVIPAESKTTLGQDHTIQLQVFAAGRGRKTALEIAAQIYGVLARQRLTVTGFTASNCFYEFSDSSLDPDGEYARVVQRYRVTTTPA